MDEKPLTANELGDFLKMCTKFQDGTLTYHYTDHDGGEHAVPIRSVTMSNPGSGLKIEMR